MSLGIRACHVRNYSSAQRIPKKAAGAFTSNQHISQPVTLNKTLVYIGPFAETIQRYKMVASLFGVCGLCAVPGLLSTGQAPALSWIGIETVSMLGRLKEDNMWLTDLKDVSGNQRKMVSWQHKTRRYSLERAVVEADPYLQGLADRCPK
ncbi:hypothetical protein BJV82DRAFT_507352 [Fennellomyces sp. T-0311]|nr:hypothetical protein BJV82DRAFT_507352 [Fennellomyces sp. T-0311]